MTSEEMIMVEMKPGPEAVMGIAFHDETWQEIFTHCLEHDPVGLPWCHQD
jgi:hypothetical protein